MIGTPVFGTSFSSSLSTSLDEKTRTGRMDKPSLPDQRYSGNTTLVWTVQSGPETIPFFTAGNSSRATVVGSSLITKSFNN